MLTKRELADFQARYANELGRHQKVVAAMRRENISLLRTQRIGAEGSAPQPLSRTANAVLGALTYYLRPKLATDARLDLARTLGGVTAQNFRSNHKRIIDDVNCQCRGQLRYGQNIGTLPHLLDALALEKSVMAADAEFNGINHQAYRQANYESRPRAHDTEEHVGGDPAPNPGERGTGSVTPAPNAVDESADPNTGFTDKDVLSPRNIGKSASGESRAKGVELSRDELVKLVNDTVAREMKKAACDYGGTELAGYHKMSGDNQIGGPPSYPGMPKRGGSMATDRQMGDHVQCLDPPSPPPSYSRYSLDLLDFTNKGCDPETAHNAALRLAEDRATKPTEKPSPIFCASGADRIGFAP
jgi:hypothetical protein